MDSEAISGELACTGTPIAALTLINAKVSTQNGCHKRKSVVPVANLTLRGFDNFRTCILATR